VLAAAVRRCPGLTVVVTSQRPLGIGGERRVRLEPLPEPAAADLFARRAAAVVPGFSLTAENADAVAAVCRAVDGLPLAVELAAARVRTLTPAELAVRLDRPLRVLTGASPDRPDRHRCLRTTIVASLDMVDEPARTVFAWLAPFVAGARLADLEDVAERLGAEPGWLLGAVTGLVDASLFRVRTDGEESRYLMADTMRDLAVDLLAARGDAARVTRVVAAHYLDRLRAAGTRRDGDGTPTWTPTSTTCAPPWRGRRPTSRARWTPRRRRRCTASASRAAGSSRVGPPWWRSPTPVLPAGRGRCWARAASAGC
jgi:predicted ATPase